ncbi:MAG: hypothetical protein HC836_35035, partial [Richelia sp. RM2_1_2]|nr:hypothetical protein [Richelia sp. RM2_1_2]
ANLYFFNPNGIIFGRNASLDIRGSFVASTAPSLIFPDNKKFSATNPEAPPLLTNNVSVPVGLQFEGMSGTITNAANLKAGQDLQLAAGNLNLENQVHAGKDLTLQATDTVKIRDSSDNPMIVTAQDKLLVEGNQIDIFALNNSHSGLFSGGDMVLRSVNQVGGDAHFAAGVNFRIEKLDGSLGDLFSPKDPVIFAAGDVSLGDYFGASLHILAGGSVTLGNVDIFFADSADNTINPNNNTLFNHSDRVADLADVTLSDGMELTIDGSIKPTLDVRAGINWSTFAGGVPGNINTGFVFPSFNDTATSADINVGNINIFLPFTDGRKVFLSNQYRPNTSLSGNITVNGGIDTTDFADGGAITLDSRGDISLGGNIDASSFGNFGNGGDITLLAGGNIQTSSQIFSNGLSAGNVTLTSAKDVLITNGAEINVRGGGSGNIAINADNLEISGGTKLRAGIGEAQGFPITKAGNIEINVVGKTIVSDEETIIGNNLGFFDSVGNSGDININTGSLEVKNGAFLIGNIFGEGDSGTINITAQNSVKFDGSGIQNGVLGIGNSGGINITTGSFAAINGSRFQADTLGTGNAGKVNITARDSIITDDFAIFTRAESGATGNGGDIKITSSFLDMIDTQLLTFTSGIGDAGNVKIVGDTIKFNDSQILTSTNDGAIGNAGKVTINATDSFNFENISQIFTDVETNAFGNAGEINITAPLLSITNNSQIATSSTGIGNAADVNITAQDISLDNSIIFARMDSPFLDFIAVGNSGNININTSLLKMSNDAQLNIRHNGIGNPGNININAEKISLDTSNINAGAFLENAGNVNIQAIDSVSLNKSSIYTSVLFGSGNGGNILIDAKSLLLANSSRIGGQSSDNILAGSAGNITVKTDDFVTLDNGSSISASAFTGTGGNVLIETGKFSVHNNSSIIAIVSGDQPAASLTINATESVEVSGGDSFCRLIL